MVSFIFLQIEATAEAATKVSNPLAMVCFIAAVVFALFGALRAGKSEDKTMLYVAAGLALALCIIGAITYSYTFQDHKSELDTLQIKYDSLNEDSKKKIKELGEAMAVKALFDTTKVDLQHANNENKRLTAELVELKEKIKQLESRTIKGDDYLLALDGRPYDYVQGYAVVKNKKGKWGYLHRGQFISKVDFEYDEACRFYSGMAAVRCGKDKKWGFINLELELAIPCQYDDVQGFQGDSTKVKLNGEWFWIDKKGKQIQNSLPPSQ